MKNNLTYKIRTILSLTFLLIVCGKFNAQQQMIKPLTVGEIVPENMVLKMVNYSTKVTNLSAFNNKYILLDFWSTDCTSCISMFPKVQSLQDKYSKKLKILLVNSHSRDSEKAILNIYNKVRKSQNSPFTLPTVFNNSVLSDLFPHQLIPHYVWIGPDGKVQAITDAYEVTDENIRNFVNDSLAELPLKIDIDKSKPLFSGEYFPEQKMDYYGVLFKGKISGLSYGVKKRMYNDSLQRGIMMSNMRLYSMYLKIAGDLIGDFHSKRMILDIKDSAKLFQNKSCLSEDAWNKKNLYTLDLILPIDGAAELNKYVLSLLNNSTDYYGRVEMKKVKCIVVKRREVSDKCFDDPFFLTKIIGKQGREITNEYLLPVINYLNQLQNSEAIFIDESSFSDKINFIISENTTMKDLRDALLARGLDLQTVEKEVQVFVLSEKEKEMNQHALSIHDK